MMKRKCYVKVVWVSRDLIKRAMKTKVEGMKKLYIKEIWRSRTQNFGTETKESDRRGGVLIRPIRKETVKRIYTMSIHLSANIANKKQLNCYIADLGSIDLDQAGESVPSQERDQRQSSDDRVNIV